MNLTRLFYRAAAVLVYVAAIGCNQPAKSVTEEAANCQ